MVRALAITIAVLLVAGVASTFIVGDADNGRGATPAAVTIEVTPDSVPRPGASDLEAVLPSLLQFVQTTRGLQFTKPVEVTLLGDKDFRARLASMNKEQTAEAASETKTTGRVLQALGLLEPGVDIDKALASLLGDAVAGFYDPETADLVVRGENLTVGVRATLVHELTHALQDQHFDLIRKDLDERDDEASTGFTGVVEGDATRIERLYVDSLDPVEQKRAEAEEAAAGAGISPDVPLVLLQLIAFPYAVGPEFTSAVVAQAGVERLDQAFAEPPTTSEQLLHPEAFLDGQPVTAVEPPKADGAVIDEGVLGELGLLLVLNTTGTSGQRAAAGWGGDRYVAWRSGGQTCVRVAIAMDTLQDDAELRAALDGLARLRKGVRFSGRGPFVLTSCG